MIFQFVDNKPLEVESYATWLYNILKSKPGGDLFLTSTLRKFSL